MVTNFTASFYSIELILTDIYAPRYIYFKTNFLKILRFTMKIPKMARNVREKINSIPKNCLRNHGKRIRSVFSTVDSTKSLSSRRCSLFRISAGQMSVCFHSSTKVQSTNNLVPFHRSRVSINVLAPAPRNRKEKTRIRRTIRAAAT